ncbi:MAG: molecular chaperone HtpG, partial [Clostridiales bacterium]|nr:molecular chaperone HtpG [Clostridiales bacterium]
GSYKDKQLKSVTEDDLGLESEDKKEETEKQEEENKELLEFIKETLDGAVSAVKLSTKLKSSPACLGTQGPVSLEMEKYFSSIPGTGEHMKAERVLELNASHPVFGVLKTAFAEDKEKAASYAKLLHFESLLTSGMEIADPGAFADLVNSLIV